VTNCRTPLVIVVDGCSLHGRLRHYCAVAINNKDRKVLWARSGNRCALCRRPLVAERTDTDREAIVGDEAHIAARSPGGPRYGECPDGSIDTYDNLILLCKVDHKKVDDQPGHFTSKTLRKAKADHEAWVDETLQQRDGATRISFPDHAGMFPLTRLRSGSDVWNVVNGAHRYFLEDLEDLEDLASDEDLDCSASFLQNAKDWGEISADVTEAGMRAVRDAKRSLTTDLNALRARGIVAVGGTRQGVIRGGVLPPGPMVRRASHRDVRRRRARRHIALGSPPPGMTAPNPGTPTHPGQPRRHQ
jgi:hypothetical protein